MESDQVVQGFTWPGLENHQGQSLHNITGQLATLLGYPHEKKFSPYKQFKPVFQFTVLPLIFPPGSTVESLWPEQPPCKD